jgi:CRP/FNR family transcriptional regulator, dissimilatory nitrate respiration regulator
MTREEALRRVVFLKEASRDAIAALQDASYVQALSAGEVLFLEAQPSTGLSIVLEGSVREGKTDTRGRELVLTVHRAGSALGELPLFDGGNHPTQALAGAEGAQVLCVPRERFIATQRRYPEITQGMVRALAIHQRKLLEMLKAQALHTVRARLAAYLLAQPGATTTFKLEESHESIAAQVGTVREVISRTLNQLADLELVSLQGRTVTVIDRQALERLAQGE